jgi:hypothetical protein
MTLWLVKEEFVPLEGAVERSDDELNEVAATVRSQFAAHEAAANGKGNRFIVSAKIEVESDAEAESWGRAALFDFVDDALPDWRLDRLVVWLA